MVPMVLAAEATAQQNITKTMIPTHINVQIVLMSASSALRIRSIIVLLVSVLHTKKTVQLAMRLQPRIMLVC